MNSRQLVRSLLHELRGVRQDHRLAKTPAVSYVMELFRKHQVTDQLTCKAEEEMKYLAVTYTTYLHSSRKSQELRDEYNGRGERSIQETASLVGFKLPHDPSGSRAS